MATKRLKPKNAVPYSGATSGDKARSDITDMLRRFGCESVGMMDNFTDQSVVLAFKHKGRAVQLSASAKGWAQLYINANPYRTSSKTSEADYRRAALAQGQIAVNSMLRDWIKGQLTAVECGMLSFDAVFMPHMLSSDGRPLIERITEAKLLPQPKT